MNNLAHVATILMFSLFLAHPAYAKDKTTMQDKIIGSTFKAAAKGFVAVADLDKVKQDNIYKINKMEEDKFRRRYAEIHKAIEGLPQEIKSVYGISENMTKEEVIKDIKCLDKDKIYKIIDAVPDKVIAGQFRQYISRKKSEIQNSNLAGQVNNVWAKLIARLNYSR